MTEFVWPNLGRQSTIKWRHVSNSEIYPSPLTGGVQTSSRPGDRLACSIDVTNSSGAERAQLRALVARMRGKSNRVYVPNYGFKRRGSFPASDLFANSDFSLGTAGWTASSAVLAASNGVLRMTASSGAQAQLYQNAAVPTANVPYVLRSLVLNGRANSPSLSAGVQLSFTGFVNSFFTDRGYKLVTYVAPATAAANHFPFFVQSTSGAIAGDEYDVYFASLSRCFLTDSGGNLFTRSKELDHADWARTALAGVTANDGVGPDGVADAERIIPNTSNATHYIVQTKTVTSAAQDLMICGYFFASGYSFVRLHMTENTSAGSFYQVFNLSTGALGTTNGASATWSNLRAVIKNMGGGWYYCALVGFKNNAATSISGYAIVESVDGVGTYAGNGTSGIYASNMTMFPSSVFALPVTSSAAAVAAQLQSGGSGIRVKGLPASQTGLLLPGDEFEIDKQLKVVTASLDTDAAGLGYLQFEPPLPRAVADNTPIIVQSPLCKMILIEDGEYDARPGGFSDFHFELVQDLNP